MILTDHEKKMLERLKKAGILNWTAIRADDTRTLNRLVKKGAARETVGRSGRRAWEPVTPTGARIGCVGHDCAECSDRDAQLRDLKALLAELLEQLGERDRGDGNAPGHAHDVSGVWDSDNGDLAGKRCAWCATWAKAKAMGLTTPNV